MSKYIYFISLQRVVATIFQAFSHIYWHLKPEFLLEEDRYDDAWVLFAVEDGSFRFRIGDAEGVAGGGDLVLCPPGMPFKRKTLTPLSFHFLRFLPGDQTNVPETAGFVPVRHPQRLASTLAFLRQNNPPPSGRQKKHLMADILLLCMETATAQRPEADSQDLLMRDMREWIRAHAPDASFTIELAASRAGLTPVQFSRRFKAAFGLTAIAFLTECRIDLAKRLLANTDRTLDWIAERCGYENGFYLSRVFKRRTQVSPAEFRRIHRV